MTGAPAMTRGQKRWAIGVLIILTLLVLPALGHVLGLALLVLVVGVTVAMIVTRGRLLVMVLAWRRRRQWVVLRASLAEWCALPPTAFEHAVGDLLVASGWRRVRHTGGPGDRGVDLVGTTPDGLSAVVQCKRIAPATTVSSPVLQQLVGSQHIHHADQAWIVTTGSLTAEARRIALSSDVVIVDGRNLIAMATRANVDRRAA
jgi:restriction system protein